jgi:uroporphyrinogen decarboxylase
MPRGTPSQVRDEVRRLGDISARGGGYVCTTCHFLMDDVPVENVLAMYGEATNYRPSGEGTLH